MATPQYPSVLPLPQTTGYGQTPKNNTLRTEMESGNARQRKRFTSSPTEYSATFRFTQDQFAIFEAWYKHQANEGANYFEIELLGGLGLQVQEARFTQQYDAPIISGNTWEVNTVLEIRERKTLTAEELAVTLVLPPVELESYSNRLHTVVHTQL